MVHLFWPSALSANVLCLDVLVFLVFAHVAAGIPPVGVWKDAARAAECTQVSERRGKLRILP
jgi:hypothetical protein